MEDFTIDDRLALHELAARYGNTLDDRDWDRFEPVFTADCRYELRGFGRSDVVLNGSAVVRSYMEASARHPVAHHVTNVEIDATGTPVRMLSKIVGTLPDGNAGSADYHDTVVRSAVGWQIADRLVTLRRAPRD